jgi:hypothetical protein
MGGKKGDGKKKKEVEYVSFDDERKEQVFKRKRKEAVVKMNEEREKERRKRK